MWKEAAVLCFPGNKNVLGAAEVMGVMRETFSIPLLLTLHVT